MPFDRFIQLPAVWAQQYIKRQQVHTFEYRVIPNLASKNRMLISLPCLAQADDACVDVGPELRDGVEGAPAFR
jgi:hypothetical protein